MCGRFALGSKPKAVAELFSLPEPPEILKPRYNIAPSQPVAVVALKGDGTRALGMVKWGLVPHWANDPSEGTRPINARSETVETNPVFRDAFRHKRCLVPASGYYEWKTGPRNEKTPYYFHLKSGEPFAFAGLWDVWGEAADKVVTCCTITVPPNELAATVHDRMPLIIPRERFDRWLSPDTPMAELRTLLTPYPAGEMDTYRVGKAVGNPRTEGPQCIEPYAEPKGLF